MVCIFQAQYKFRDTEWLETAIGRHESITHHHDHLSRQMSGMGRTCSAEELGKKQCERLTVPVDTTFQMHLVYVVVISYSSFDRGMNHLKRRGMHFQLLMLMHHKLCIMMRCHRILPKCLTHLFTEKCQERLFHAYYDAVLVRLASQSEDLYSFPATGWEAFRQWEIRSEAKSFG